MKYYSFILLFPLLFLNISCSDNLVDAGIGIQPTSDSIFVASDTFHVATENVYLSSMYSNQDSLLLGSFYDKTFGTTTASILAQVMCPIGFVFPPNTVPDSANLVLFTNSWIGDKYSPLDVNVYEMNKGTFTYSALYSTNINPGVYTDSTNLLGRRVVTARDASKLTKDSTALSIKLSDKFVQDFYAGKDYYTSETAFTNFFGGVYVKTNFGASTILNVGRLRINYYYHYPIIKNGVETMIKGVLSFSANDEVRQVNVISHPDEAEVKLKYNQRLDSVNYISSPANIQTKVTIPLAALKAKMDSKIGIDNKKLILNYALMQVEVADTSDSKFPQPFVQSVLLIKEDEVESFFLNGKLPTGSNAVVSSLSATGKQIYYSFNIAKLLTAEIKNAGTEPLKPLKLRLVPVNLTYNSSGSVVGVKQDGILSSVAIRSGQNKKSPMRVKLIYSGF